jgi:hypothetical protein
MNGRKRWLKYWASGCKIGNDLIWEFEDVGM